MIKSRKMLIEYLKSTLITEDTSANTNEEAFMMAPKKDPDLQQVIRNEQVRYHVDEFIRSQ